MNIVIMLLKSNYLVLGKQIVYSYIYRTKYKYSCTNGSGVHVGLYGAYKVSDETSYRFIFYCARSVLCGKINLVTNLLQ